MAFHMPRPWVLLSCLTAGLGDVQDCSFGSSCSSGPRTQGHSLIQQTSTVRGKILSSRLCHPVPGTGTLTHKSSSHSRSAVKAECHAKCWADSLCTGYAWNSYGGLCHVYYGAEVVHDEDQASCDDWCEDYYWACVSKKGAAPSPTVAPTPFVRSGSRSCHFRRHLHSPTCKARSECEQWCRDSDACTAYMWVRSWGEDQYMRPSHFECRAFGHWEYRHSEYVKKDAPCYVKVSR